MRKILAAIVLAGLLPLLSLTSADAATRTWVSGVGDDVNPCSRTAPCKTFGGAISKTDAHGEISVLDPGGYGAVTITKSLSIVAEGSEGSILACGSNGIIINAAATDVVNIHGVLIEGCNNGLIGIKILSAGSVHIRKCLIRGFTTVNSIAVSIAPSAGSVNVVISDCAISKNKQGVHALPTGTGVVTATVERTVVNNTKGNAIRAGNGATIRVSNSVVTDNNHGLLAQGSGQIISFG